MKKRYALLLSLVWLLLLVGCNGGAIIEGSEKSCAGTVTDRAMSVVNEGDRRGRAYISIDLPDGGGESLWLAADCECDAEIGDYVLITSAIEAKTGLLVATEITVVEPKP